MDALTSAALDSLAKEALPKLLKELGRLSALTPAERKLDDNLHYYIHETLELLQIMQKWSQAGVGSANKHAAENDIEIENLSEEESLMMMASMEEQASPPVDVSGGHDLSDDEARRLLAEMDAPTAHQVATAIQNMSEDMPDDVARKLLDEMDAPVATGNIAEKNQSDERDISDDEARKLLALMDAPAESAATATLETKAAAVKVEDDSADFEDEAMKMLRSMESENESNEPATPQPIATNPALATKSVAKQIAVVVDASHDSDPDETYTEVPEWKQNDFASDPDMMNDFMTNSEELLETLDRTLLELEANPTSKDTIEEIFRAAHTFKGGAGMFGFTGIESLMHKMENLFDLIRKGKLTATSEVIDVVLKGIDMLRVLVEAVKSQQPSGQKLAPIIIALIRICKGKSPGLNQGSSANSNISSMTDEHAVAQAASIEPTARPEGAVAASGHGEGEAPKKAAHNSGESTIRVDLERLDMLVNLIGELVTDRTRFMNIEDELRNHHSHLPITADMAETVQLFGRHMNDVQDIIMKVRMVPIGNAFNKYPRVVRDLAKQLGKKIELVMEGEATELDKTLVEQIADPLIHLIRNACDHGIETPDIRIDHGKDPIGKVYLSAHQEGNNIVISIQDDGKGMDASRILAKAVEKGMVKADQKLDETEILNLIFEAGFSTAEQVTNVSGRGVGMDVVKKQINKLKGNIQLSSKVGQGSTVKINLPLTLAIVQSLLVQCKEEIYAIPQASVIESIRISPSEIQKVGDLSIVKRMNKVLPLINLGKTLDLGKKKEDFWYQSDNLKNQGKQRSKMRRSDRQDRLFVVVVGNADKRFGIVVDGLMNQQEIVIKSMGTLLKDLPCIAGGAVLGSGEVVLVLDVPELERFVKSTSHINQMNLSA